jgi:hypothetical protein
MDMRSALDRLMDNVAGSGERRRRRHTLIATPDESMTTSVGEDSMATDERAGATLKPCAQPIERAAADSAIIYIPGDDVIATPSRSASISSIPPPPPPKDAIRNREDMILEKRRQARRQEEEENQGFYTPPKMGLGARRMPAQLAVVVDGRPSRRRSMSTGDIEGLSEAVRKRGEALLDMATFAAEEDPLADSIDRELKKLERRPTKKSVRVFPASLLDD